MNYREIASLIQVEEKPNENGRLQETEVAKRSVFVDVRSVTRMEFFAARQTGIEEVISFSMRAWDYQGERRVKYDGKKYKVERVYSKDGEMIQLNCSEMKMG